jgi:hypothetical protein
MRSLQISWTTGPPWITEIWLVLILKDRYNNLVLKYVHIIRSCYLSFRGDGQL